MNKNDKQKVVAQYLRVSTDEQAQSGFGLDIQREKLDALAILHDYKTVDSLVYVDEGLSGTLPADKRPALKKLLADAKKKKFDGVIVYKVDRLARDNYIIIGVVRELSRANLSTL